MPSIYKYFSCRRTRARSWGTSIICFGIALTSATPAIAQDATVSRASEYCSKNPAYSADQAGHLSEDGMVLCFDGAIRTYLDLTPMLRMKKNGVFVVRSHGGSIGPALVMADLLWERNATVVVRNFCLSACANAIFVASKSTYVLSHSVVAWHGGPVDCRDPEMAQAVVSLGLPCTDQQDFARTFYEKREVGRRHMVIPPTDYTKRMLHNALRKAANRDGVNRRGIFWMWHPKNHGDYFKNRITYEAFPETQAAVDAIMIRSYNQAQIIYDPAIEILHRQ